MLFFLVFAYFIIFMFRLIITRVYWDGLFTKKEFISSLSCVSGTVIVSVLYVRQFIKVKTSTSIVSPISSDSLFWWLLLFCLKVIALLELPWVSVVSLLVSSVPSIRSVNVCSFVFVSVISIPIICSVLNIAFLFIRVSVTHVFWFSYWYPVFIKPLFFFWKPLFGLQLSCLTLCSPLFLQNYCNFLIETTFN